MWLIAGFREKQAKKLIRIANNDISRGILWRTCHSVVPCARVCGGSRLAKGSTRNVSSVRSKVARSETAPVDGARRIAIGRPRIQITLPGQKGKSLSKGHVSFALVIALGAAHSGSGHRRRRAGSEGAAERGPGAPTRAALIKGLDATFKAVDTNGDGSLSAAELGPPRPRSSSSAWSPLRGQRRGGVRQARHQQGRSAEQGRVHGRRAHLRQSPNGAAIVAQLDKNKDGKVSPTNIGRRGWRAFDKLDTNHDGTLSATERQAARPSSPLGPITSRSPRALAGARLRRVLRTILPRGAARPRLRAARETRRT